MAFPLVGATPNYLVHSATPSYTTVTAVTSFTRHWTTFVGGSSYAAQHRSNTVNIHNPLVVTVLSIGNYAFPGQRRWGGIGGLQLTPSFPQLNKNNTIFPSAL